MRSSDGGPVVGACDDGRVEKLGEGYTIMLCLSWSREDGILDITFLPIRIDGLDATSITLYLASSLSPKPDVVLLDSITAGGFNIVSPASIHEYLRVPVVVVYTYKPSFRRVLEGLQHSNLPLKALRARVLRLLDRAKRLDTTKGTVYVITWPPGYDPRDIILYTQVYDRKPAPLRAAHYISSALSRVLGSLR